MDRYQIWIQETAPDAPIPWRIGDRHGRLMMEGTAPTRQAAETAARSARDHLLHPPVQPRPLDLFEEGPA